VAIQPIINKIAELASTSLQFKSQSGLKLVIFDDDKIESEGAGNNPNTNELNEERFPHKQTPVLL
jgi:hypothetical protein